jgi:hypothetical protein
LYSEIEEEEEEEEDTQKWQNCTKAAITIQFFSNVRDSVKLNVSVKPNFTAMVT